MTGVRPAVFTVPPGVALVDALAAELLREAAAAAPDDPLALSRYTVLLPTRRACRALAEAMLRASDGHPILLPRLRPLGDIDAETLALSDDAEAGDAADILDLPPAIAPARRLLLLARMIMAREGADADQAVWLAHELARFLDQVQTEALSFDGLAALVPDTYAAHWRTTLDFLAILTKHWPTILAEDGALDPVDRRNRLIDRQAERWRDAPPADPVIAAGSTGSVPATARLLAVVARLPRGRVVLPGLDREMDAESWAALDAAHPQYGLRRLLESIGIAREDVTPWPVPATTPAVQARARLIGEIMRPAATSDAWPAPTLDVKMAREAMVTLSRIDCASPQEEAGVIAVTLRQVLETADKTAALVTPDRILARRVAAELRRWDVAIDDSAGQPLAATPPGSFLRLTARMMVDSLAPVALLAACKHPLAAGGQAPAAFRTRIRRLEVAILRGLRPAPGFAGLRAALAARDEDRHRQGDDVAGLARWLDGLETMAAGFATVLDRGPVALADLLRAHVGFAEALAASDAVPGAARLWAGAAGEQAAALVAELLQAPEDFPMLSARLYPGLLDALMAGRVVRPRFGLHPRLNIWGPLEARLQHADLLVLGGLNEGTWPGEVRADPWMSRDMRARFGLPPVERRVGLAAHDFAQAFCAPELVLTRASRVDGTPTVPSRWLLRLETVLRGLGLHDPSGRGRRMAPWKGADIAAWWQALNTVSGAAAIRRPAPRPPLALRPRQLSVTRIEIWRRNPYAIYARSVLRLERLDDIDAEPGAADYGTFIHAALDRFVAAFPGALPGDARDRLLAIGRDILAPERAAPELWAFWWPRFRRVADWFVATERARRETIAAIATEVSGKIEITGPGGPFLLIAKADRIERRRDGALVIVDYKTGTVPQPKDVKSGWAPQLSLEAVMAARGGFDGVPAAAVAELAYWKLSGGDPPAAMVPVKADVAALAAAARDGLAALIAAFDDDSTPYLAVPDSANAPNYDDYAHLARIREWSIGGDEDSS